MEATVRFRNVLVLALVLMLGIAVISPQEEAIAQEKKPIYVSFYFHFDMAADRKGFDLSIKNTTDVFEKYGIKGQYGLTSTIPENLEEDYPDTVAKIKRLKMPISWHGDVHISAPGADPWLAATHYLDVSDGRNPKIDANKIGGYLGVQRVFGVIPLSSDVMGRGDDIFTYLGAGSYAVNTSLPGEDIYRVAFMPTLHEQHIWPGAPRINVPSFMGLGVGEKAPYCPDPVEWLSILAKNFPRDKAFRLSCMTHSQNSMPEQHQMFEKIVSFVTSHPEDFKVVWPDTESAQWRPENSPLAFYKRTYGLDSLEQVMNMPRPTEPLPYQRALTKQQVAQGANFILQKWPNGTHFTDLGGPPEFVNLPADDLSLTELFQGLAYSLAEYQKSGKLPAEVKLKKVKGPVDAAKVCGPDVQSTIEQGMPASGTGAGYMWPAHGLADGKDVVKAAADAAASITDRLPLNVPIPMPEEASRGKEPKIVPVKVNTAEFLYGMAQAYRLIDTGASLGPIAFSSSKFTATQPGGQGTQTASSPRGAITEEEIDAYWNYVPPRGSQDEAWFMSTISTGSQLMYNDPWTPVKERGRIGPLSGGGAASGPAKAKSKGR